MSPRKPGKLFNYTLVLPELESPHELEIRYSKPRLTKLHEEACALQDSKRGSFQIDGFTLFFKDKSVLSVPACTGPVLEELIKSIFLAVKLFIEDTANKYIYQKYTPRKLPRLTPGILNWSHKDNCSITEFAFVESLDQWVAKPFCNNQARIYVDDQTFKENWVLYNESAFKKRAQIINELRTLMEEESDRISTKYVELVDAANEKYLIACETSPQEPPAQSFQQVLETYRLPLDGSH